MLVVLAELLSSRTTRTPLTGVADELATVPRTDWAAAVAAVAIESPRIRRASPANCIHIVCSAGRGPLQAFEKVRDHRPRLGGAGAEGEVLVVGRGGLVEALLQR